ncbi:MAG TPA: nucleotidyltransferase [Candidatus Sulfotelmatobacter sp.]|nr:nucleotidyltransferase [Candidatus Sulfotelmatobacter sp.]
MAIPTRQLETWSGQGSVTQSKQTYAAVKNALEAANATYTDRDFKVFLQGSYGNDTNIWAESDVDVVIRYDGAFFRDISSLPADQLAAYNNYFSGPVNYPYDNFKRDVQAALKSAFGNSVKPGTKAIKIDASNSRRSADVVVAFEYRRYYKFNSVWDENCTKGIGFLNSAGTLIANYPDQHRENLTTKHQATDSRFKPTVRMFKNMRTRLVADGAIADGIAPSYYIEGLLYNVPNDNFVSDESDRVYNILKWLGDTRDRSMFVCANEQYYLLRDDSPVCWPKANGARFIDAAINLWNDWR